MGSRPEYVLWWLYHPPSAELVTCSQPGDGFQHGPAKPSRRPPPRATSGPARTLAPATCPPPNASDKSRISRPTACISQRPLANRGIHITLSRGPRAPLLCPCAELHIVLGLHSCQPHTAGPYAPRKLEKSSRSAPRRGPDGRVPVAAAPGRPGDLSCHRPRSAPGHLDSDGDQLVSIPLEKQGRQAANHKRGEARKVGRKS